MNVTLTPEWEKFVAGKIVGGEYQNPNEVVYEALKLLRDQDELDADQAELLGREIDIGLAQAEQGRVAPFRAQDILARVREQKAANPRRAE